MSAPVARPRRWALWALGLAMSLLEPGATRERYRQELTSELWGLSAREQLGQVLSVLRGAPALRRALRTTGQLAFPHSLWWCRLTLHHRWRQVHSDDGAAYRRCRACGLDDDGTTASAATTGTGIMAYGIHSQ